MPARSVYRYRPHICTGRTTLMVWCVAPFLCGRWYEAMARRTQTGVTDLEPHPIARGCPPSRSLHTRDSTKPASQIYTIKHITPKCGAIFFGSYMGNFKCTKILILFFFLKCRYAQPRPLIAVFRQRFIHRNGYRSVFPEMTQFFCEQTFSMN